MTPWLVHGLRAAGLDVACLDARRVKAALQMQLNKTDENDAEGLAQIMRTGWYRAVHVKSHDAHRARAVLGARAQLVGIAVAPVECGGDREVAQPVRADRETGLGAEPADDVVDRRAGQTLPFAGPVEIDEQRTGLGPAGLEPGSEGGPGRLGQTHQLPRRALLAGDKDPVSRQVDILDV